MIAISSASASFLGRHSGWGQLIWATVCMVYCFADKRSKHLLHKEVQTLHGSRSTLKAVTTNRYKSTVCQ